MRPDLGLLADPIADLYSSKPHDRLLDHLISDILIYTVLYEGYGSPLLSAAGNSIGASSESAAGQHQHVPTTRRGLLWGRHPSVASSLGISDDSVIILGELL